MRIDAHAHADARTRTLENALQNMDAKGIDKAWLLTWESPAGEYPAKGVSVKDGIIIEENPKGVPVPFAFGLDWKERAPERFILGYAPDPRRADAMAVFREAVDKYGVQVCGEVKYRMMYDNPDALEMFRFCGDAGLPVVLHFDYPDATECGDKYVRHNWWCGGGIDVLERLLNLCPKTNFLGHAPGFWGHISNDDLAWTKGYSDEPVIPGGRVEYLLEHYSNLYCDMSAGSGAIALSRDIDYSRRLIERFPDRFLYGRDGFHDKHDKLLEALNLQGEIAELVFHGNALRLARKL